MKKIVLKILYDLKNIPSLKIGSPILGHSGHHGLNNNVMWRSSSQGKHPMDSTSIG